MFARFALVLLVLLVLVGGLAWIKYGQIQRDIAMFSHPMPAPTVSVQRSRRPAGSRPWRP